jgi:hypothetical protein
LISMAIDECLFCVCVLLPWEEQTCHLTFVPSAGMERGKKTRNNVTFNEDFWQELWTF